MKDKIIKIFKEEIHKIHTSDTKDENSWGSEDINLSNHKGYDGWVFIHRNLNKPPYWSIKQGKSGGNVIGYDKSIKLKDVEFKVQKGGQSRVRKEKRKNVHAGVIGKIISSGDEYNTKGWTLVTYNPYVNSSFVEYETSKPIYEAKEAILKNTKEVWVKKYDNEEAELTEKWTEKYKNSINCNNTKVFSQRAHCQGRKKRDLDEYSRTLRMARRQGSGVRFPKSVIKNSPNRFREYTKRMNEDIENEDKELYLLKIKRAIEKILDTIITGYSFNNDKTKIFFFSKNKKFLLNYIVKDKKLWYDYSLRDLEIENRLKVDIWIDDIFKEALKSWFDKHFETKGYIVKRKYGTTDPSDKPNIEGANMALY